MLTLKLFRMNENVRDMVGNGLGSIDLDLYCVMCLCRLISELIWAFSHEWRG